MSAVAEQPAAALAVPKPSGARTYVAKRDDLLLILERERRRVDAGTGEVIETVLGKRLQFTDGQLVVPERGAVRGAPGGVARLPRQYVIDHLEGRGEPGDKDYVEPHPLFGDSEEGFILLPTIVPKMSTEEAQAVTGLAIAGDEQALEALLKAERAGFDRPELTELVTDTLAKVRAAREPS
jgi:hypothetical protein